MARSNKDADPKAEAAMAPPDGIAGNGASPDVGQKRIMVQATPSSGGHVAMELLTSGPSNTDDWILRAMVEAQEPKLFIMQAIEEQGIAGDGVDWDGLRRTYLLFSTAVGGVPRTQYVQAVVGHEERRRPSLFGSIVDKATSPFKGKGGGDS